MTYSLIDRLADLGTPTAEEAIAQLAAKDELIRELVRAAKPAKTFIDDTKYRPGRDATSVILGRALTRAKELGYE